MAAKIALLALLAASTAAWNPQNPIESIQTVNFGLPNGGISRYSTKLINEKQAILQDRRKTPNPAGKRYRRAAWNPQNPIESIQTVNFGLPNGGISRYSTKLVNEKQAILQDRRKTPNPAGKRYRRAAWNPQNPIESIQMVNFGLPNGGISRYSTKLVNEKQAILQDRRKTPSPTGKRY